jgi:single-stranded DNA-binding protein
MNSVNLMGRVTGGVELQYTILGDPVCPFELSVYKTETLLSQIPRVAWGELAEEICKNIRAGDHVGVSGFLEMQNTWDENGDLQRRLAVNATALYNNRHGLHAYGRVPTDLATGTSTNVDDEDIPF